MSNGVPTMTKSLVSPRDIEMLSAYLDGQLSPKDVARLRVRLQENPQMQITLDELRITRAAVRSLPRLRAPRNFTLTPQMVGGRVATRRRAGVSPYPAFGFASLLASLLLVLVFVADRLSFVNTAQTGAIQSAAQATQMEGLVQTMVVEGLATEAAALPQAEAMKAAAPAEPASVSEESMRIAEPTEAVAEALSLAYPEPTSAALSELAPEETLLPAPEAQQAGDVSLAMTGTLTETTVTSLTLTQAATPGWGIGGGLPEFTVTPELDETPVISSTLSLTATAQPSPLPTDTVSPVADSVQLMQAPAVTPAEITPDLPVSPRVPARTVFLVVEIALAILAAASALVFLILYRKSG